MTINFVFLFTAFLNQSKQEEIRQSSKIDLFTEGPVNLYENDIGISLFTIPPIPANIGTVVAT